MTWRAPPGSVARRRLGAAAWPYIPRLAIDWLAQSAPQAHRRIDGSLLFADVSGFTRLSERLAVHGRVGAEEVVGLVDDVLTALLVEMEPAVAMSSCSPVTRCSCCSTATTPPAAPRRRRPRSVAGSRRDGRSRPRSARSCSGSRSASRPGPWTWCSPATPPAGSSWWVRRRVRWSGSSGPQGPVRSSWTTPQRQYWIPPRCGAARARRPAAPTDDLSPWWRTERAFRSHAAC